MSPNIGRPRFKLILIVVHCIKGRMEKTQIERLLECMNIAKGLDANDVVRPFDARIEIDYRIQRFVKHGEAWSGTVPIPELKRVAIINLPLKKNVDASITLRAAQ